MTQGQLGDTAAQCETIRATLERFRDVMPQAQRTRMEGKLAVLAPTTGNAARTFLGRLLRGRK